METAFFITDIVIVAALLLSVIYTVGVVWRVEMKLDTSYKFFLASVVFILSAELIDLYAPVGAEQGNALAVKALHALFALSFLAGILFMRDIVRDLVGEDGSIELSERNRE